MSLNSTATPFTSSSSTSFLSHSVQGLGDFFQKLYQVFRDYKAPTSGSVLSAHQNGTDATTGIITTRNLDLYQISSRVNRSFFTSRDGPPPFTTFYIVLLILALGLIVALLWLSCACFYHTMRRIKSWCPSWKPMSKKKSKSSDPEDPALMKAKEMPTPEIIEQRRQDRLSLLQKECENLEQQLTDERSQTLTSRASDSDLEYLGAMEDSPPLKRNSISLQDIPQSVVRIRREKQLRQLKEEIEHLQNLSRQVSERDLHGSSKSPLLTDIKFDFQGRGTSSTNSPVEVSVIEPLSQHISHLKAQRKLQEIRAEIEDLAIHLVHADEIKAKTSSLQDLPRSALVAKRQENLLSISKEIENIKTYKLQERSILHTVLPAKPQDHEKQEILAKLNKDSGKSFSKPGSHGASPSKTPLLKRQESEMSETSTTKGEPAFTHSSSLKRTREQQLNRVRVELKELSYKLNLNYSFDHEPDREKERILPKDWPKKQSSCFSRENSIK